MKKVKKLRKARNNDRRGGGAGAKIRRDWPLGFLGFLGIKGIMGIVNKNWVEVLWMVWFIWFIYFLPRR